MKRIEALKQTAFEQKDFDGFLIANEAYLLYFAGFPGASCLLIPKKGENKIYVIASTMSKQKPKEKAFKSNWSNVAKTLRKK